MKSKLITKLKQATWFLHSGIAPSNVNQVIKTDLEKLNHMTSKKFAMTMVAIGVIAFMYFSSVACLFLFKGDPHVTALVNMYKDMIIAVASIAATLVGIQGLVDWKYNSNSSVDSNSKTIVEDITSKLTSNVKDDDYDISGIIL
jgi:hypothetical protein